MLSGNRVKREKNVQGLFGREQSQRPPAPRAAWAAPPVSLAGTDWASPQAAAPMGFVCSISSCLGHPSARCVLRQLLLCFMLFWVTKFFLGALYFQELHGREPERTPGDSELQGSLACWLPGITKGWTQLNDWTSTIFRKWGNLHILKTKRISEKLLLRQEKGQDESGIFWKMRTYQNEDF